GAFRDPGPAVDRVVVPAEVRSQSGDLDVQRQSDGIGQSTLVGDVGEQGQTVVAEQGPPWSTRNADGELERGRGGKIPVRQRFAEATEVVAGEGLQPLAH